MIVEEHALKTQILIYLWPVNTKIGQLKILPLTV